MQKIITKNKRYLLFVLIVILIGFISGLLYYTFLNNDIKNDIVTTLNNYNNFNCNFILKDLIVMSIILVLSFFVIGFPLGVFYLFYESFANSFLLISFISAYNLKGFIYIILYLIINKLLVFILIIFFIKKIINISRFMIGLIIYKRDNQLKDKLFLNFKNSLYILISVLVINIILYFISPLIFKHLTFFLN